MNDIIKWSELTSDQRDGLMTEKVFRWQWIPAGRYGPHVKEGTNWLLPENGLSGIKSDLSAGWITIAEDRLIPRNWIPHYTTSLDAAWLIVEKMKEDGRNNGLFVQWQYHLAYLYGRPSYRDTLYDLNAESICIAALKACGVEVEHE